MSLSSAQLAPLRLPAFRNLFLATLGSSVGHAPRRGRARDRRPGADGLGPLGRRRARRRVPADGHRRALPRAAPRPAPAALADDRRGRAPVGVFAALPFAPSAGDGRRRSRPSPVSRPASSGRPSTRACRTSSDEELPRANALLQTVENLSWAIGPIVGGILVAAAGPSAAYAINAVSFVVSIVLVAADPAAPAAERAGALARLLARPRGRLRRDAPLAVDASPSSSRGESPRSASAPRTSRDLPREAHVPRRRLRLRSPLRRDRRRPRARQPLRARGCSSRCGVAVTYGGSLALMAVGLPGGRGQPERLGCGLLRSSSASGTAPRSRATRSSSSAARST